MQYLRGVDNRRRLHYGEACLSAKLPDYSALNGVIIDDEK
jgi:hypothetical protein